MLCEILCENFQQKKITFHNGLNVVLGDNLGANSIGKSTLLMIIDFVFGGKDYLIKSTDVQKNIGHHIINFCFEFDDGKFYFSRDTDDSERVYVCYEGYIKKEDWTLSDYTEWLNTKYHINLKYLSFRDFVGRFFRIYGKENLNEKRPLEVVNKEPSSNAVNTLLKIMNLFDGIVRFENIYKTKKEKLQVYKNAQKYDFLPKKMDKNEIKAIQSEMARLQEEKMIIEKQTVSNVFDLETEKIDKIVKLRQELTNTKRLKTRFESRLNSLEYISDDTKYVTDDDLKALTKFFPSIDIRSISEIQNFHVNLNKILVEEIEEEKKHLEYLVSSANSHIEEILNAIRDVDELSNVSSLVLRKYGELQIATETLKKKLTVNNDLTCLNNEKKDAYYRYQQIKKESITKLGFILNKKISEINDYIYDGKKKPPIFSFTENDYKFFTPDDTGTGTSFKNLIIYDLSILNMTSLPVLIHDSYLLKQIADMPIEKLLQLYQKSSKQIFISLDKVSSYTEESQEILQSHKVVELSNKGKELFGFSWNDK